MKEVALEEINRLMNRLKEQQSPDGSWRMCFESTVATDAYMIILLRSLGMNEESMIGDLVSRLERKQGVNGAWKAYHDEEGGNLSLTIEAYYALLYSGMKNKNEPKMKQAEQFIIARGGLQKGELLTKVVLAVTGQWKWPTYFRAPIELILLPSTAPINFFDFSGYARVHIAPMLVLFDQKFVLKRRNTPDLSHLLLDRSLDNDWLGESRSLEFHSCIRYIKEAIEKLIGFPEYLHQMALERTERFMLERIEEDGTLYSYFLTTFLMIFSLLALGYSKDHAVIQKAIKGLKTLVCIADDNELHMQHTTATVWNTALISHALQYSRASIDTPTIQKSLNYLMERQHNRYGDWVIRNPQVLPGGWGFSNINSINPDVDDTTAALRALRRSAVKYHRYRAAWYKGVNWVLSMQNDDGGWPAFEKNTNKEILTWIPITGAPDVSIDPSSADLTGRTLEFLGRDIGLTTDHHQVKEAVQWLGQNQERDGSWYGRWGICYIYGTWAAITGMRAVEVSENDASIQKGVAWLLHIQNNDGGWGESCKSDQQKTYIPLRTSTPSQTAWALDALISVFENPTEEINRGIQCLIEKLNHPDWTYTYPTGGGLPGSFYFYYHSYNNIWPLITLSHYVKKYS
ncbi:sporulenol synthase [Evansella vedderi]|uniref:Sporulenol synthase n=1 Tax=Evansella vedderi TaxID=38282 RepID=A0ABU0A2Q3_9BACI|nr:squalene--hopene cyclase [Evansella vedderi]MDQ0257767.1 sporulenol synthase [Evansella vedderi]